MALFESFREGASLRGVVIAVWIVLASGVLVAKYGSFWSGEGLAMIGATESAATERALASASSPTPGRHGGIDRIRTPTGPGPRATGRSAARSEDWTPNEASDRPETTRAQARGGETTSAHRLANFDASPEPDRESGREPIDYFRDLLDENPDHPTALFEVGRHLESTGRFAEAIEMYQKLLSVRDSAPELLLRMGRVHYWAHRPREALIWYGRYRDRAQLSDSMAAVLGVEEARALLEADRPEEALRVLTSGADEACGSVDRSILAARAATASGDEDSGIRFLDCLRGTEALTVERRIWLAGLYRASGKPDQALRTYEAVLSDIRSDSAREEALRAIGDLRLDGGDYPEAVEAYSSLATGPDRTLLLARAHQAGGEMESALSLLESYVEDRPDDVEARLTLARLYASLRQPEPAIRHYRAVLDMDSSLVPEVEVARAYMASADFRAAAEWAERAMDSEEDYWEAGLSLAAAYRFMGRRHEAERLFEMLEARPLPEPQIDRWQGRVALARGANLDAWMELSRFIDADGTEDGEARLLQAQASLGREDARRARRALELVPPAQDHAGQVDMVASQVDSLTRPRASLPIDYTTDANGLSRRTEALDAVLWPWSAARVRSGVGQVQLDQESARRSALSFGLSADRFFPLPNLEVGGSVALDRIELGPLSYSGDLWGRWSFRDGSELGVGLSRDLLWNSGPALDRQEPTRIVDLAALGPAPYVEGVRVNALKAFGEHAHLLGDGGRVTYPDGNRQHYLYGQVQIPLETGVGAWTVLTPRLYAESFQRGVPEYFSPREYLSAGVGGHTIRELGDWSFEAEVVPQVFWIRDDTGIAVRGLLKTSFPVGPLRPQLGGYAYLQDDDYYVYQAFARVSMPLGGGNR